MSDNQDFGTFGRFVETPVAEMDADMKSAFEFTRKLRGQVLGPHKIWPANAAQRAGFVTQYHQYNYVGTGGGTTFRINEFAPGNTRFTHRTETLDYARQLSGELDCQLDSGEIVHLKPGDVIVQRGTIHTWVNKGSVPAAIAFIMMDATPDQANGKEMRTVYPGNRNNFPA